MTRYRPWIFAYVALLAAATLMHGLASLVAPDGYRMGDWLINYHAGFVRRGLPGEVALDLARALHLATPFAIVLLIQLACYAVLFYTVHRLLRDTVLEYWTVLCVVSPATLAFQWIAPLGGFRKELLLLAGMGGLILLLQNRTDPARSEQNRREPALTEQERRSLPPLALTAYLAILGVGCALSHEGLVAFMPYLVAALAIGLGDLRRALTLAALPAALTLAAAALALHASGTLATAQGVCAALGYPLGHPLGHPPTYTAGTPFPPLCVGAISHLAYTTAQSHAEVLLYMHAAHYLRNYAILAPLALLAPAMELRRLARRAGGLPSAQPHPVSIVVTCALLAALASAPLFYVAVDWGRWIYIHVVCLFLLVLQLESKRQAAAPLAGANSEPLPTRTLDWRRVAALAFGILYATAWVLPFTGQLRWPWGYPLMLSVVLR